MIKKRVVLWWMLFTGIIVHIFQKTNINIAIISMIQFDVQNISDDGICGNNSFTLFSKKNVEKIYQYSPGEKLPWNEHTQNSILGGFFWFAWLAQFFGGILAHQFGSKLTFGLSTFIGCVLSAVIPALARIDANLVLAVRVIQGFISSLGVPAGLIDILGHWSPPHERGKFMSVFLGVSFGVAIGYPIFGAIGEHFGWPSIFYVSAILGTVWYIIWLFVVYDTPDKHPTITAEEKKYILDNIGSNISKEKLPIPWKDIMTSIPFLANICCQFGITWTILTLSIYLPSYYRFVHGIDMQTGGFIVGIAYFLKSIMSVFVATITDFIIDKNFMETQPVRKLSVFISSGIAALLMLGAPFAQCDVLMAAIFLTTAITVHSFFLTGALVAILDMSPNFSSILQGICSTIAVFAGFVSPFVTDQLPFTNNMIEKWNWLFYITAGVGLVTGLIFIIFSNSNIQSWNSGKETKTTKNAIEMVNNKNEA